MDALVAAFIAALLLGVGDRTSWLAAILSDRYSRQGAVLLGALVAFAAGNALAAFGGWLAAPILTPNARSLMLAVACLFAGVGGLLAVKRPNALERWRGGALFTSTLGLVILAFGESDQIVTAALAARSPIPAMAAIGATLGGLVAIAPAIALGEQAYLKLPLRQIRLGIGLIFICIAIPLGFGALRLI